MEHPCPRLLCASAVRIRRVLATVCPRITRLPDTRSVTSSSVNHPPKFVSELLPHEAVDDGVQAAVSVRQTHGHREHVGVDDVVTFVPVCGV